MSLLALLAAHAGAPPPDPDPDPDPTGWPVTTDPVVASLRPAGREVQPLVVGDLPALHAAVVALEATQTVLIKGSSVASLGKAGPDYRGDLVLVEGSHKGNGPTKPWCALVGETGDPADTEIWSDAPGAGGTMHTWGSVYVEGLTLRNEADQIEGIGPKYPLHMTAGEDASQVFVNCHFVSHASNGGATPSQWSGQDGGQGSYLLFYGCHFDGTPANLHGFAGNTRGLTIAFVNCTGAGFAYTDLNSGAPDRIYVVDSPLGASTVTGSSTVVRTIGTTGTITLSGGATIEVATSWPSAPGGIGETVADYWTPSRVTEAHTQAIEADTTITATPDRIYYVPVPVTHAIHATHMGVEGYPAGSVALAHSSFQGNLPVAAGGAPPSAATPHELASYYYRTIYPGQSHVYLAVRALFAATLPASSTIAAALPCWVSDDDGATLAPAAGPHPTAYIRSASAG